MVGCFNVAIELHLGRFEMYSRMQTRTSEPQSNDEVTPVVVPFSSKFHIMANVRTFKFRYMKGSKIMGESDFLFKK